MRTLIVGLAFILAAGLVAAQQSTQSSEKPTKLFVSSGEVAELIAQAESERKAGQPIVVKPMLELGSYDGHLEYRASVGAAAVHEKEAEVFYVIEGSGTLVTGGKLTNEKRMNATNLTGTAIEGGASRPVSKGDFILVPENTPHWFSSINKTLVLFSLHVPRP